MITVFFSFQIIVCLFSTLISVVEAVLPVNQFRDELVTYYFGLGYTWKEICVFLCFTHNIVVTLRQIRRTVERLGLRRYRVGSPLPAVINEVRKLCQRGLSNAGYRTIWRILKSSGRVNVSQETVRQILKTIDPAGVIIRSRRRLRRRVYINRGPNFMIHLDGYDKLKPFGISVHGAIDGYSRKILWLRAAYTNKDPKIVARYYVEYIKSIRQVPRVVRADCGTENCVIRDLQMAFRYFHGDAMSGRKSFMYGRSTSNQRIERFWGVLNGNFTTFWKNYFKDLRDSGYLHDDDPVHIECVRFCFLSLIQRDLDEITEMWNCHRIRRQTQNESPTGVSPDVLYYQPQTYNGASCGYPLPCDLNQLDIIAQRYTSVCPRLGCKEMFVQLLEEITGMDRDELEQPSTLELATRLFVELTEYLDNFS